VTLNLVVATKLLCSAHRLMMITCASYFKNFAAVKTLLSVMKCRLFNTWPLNVTNWPWGSNSIIALGISSHNGDHLCQVISKFRGLKLMERIQYVYFFNTWPLIVILIFGVASQLLRLAHCLIRWFLVPSYFNF
jgi:hypothetical protein